MKKFVIFPEKIALVDHSRILDGTLTSLADFQTDPSSFLLPRRNEDGVTLSFSGESVDIQEQAENGMMLMSDRLRKSHGVSLALNTGQWNFQMEALMRGQSAGSVANDQTASIEGPNDATAITGIDFLNAFETEKFATLLVMPVNKVSGDRLYYYLPKATMEIGDREQTLNTEQQANTLTLTGLALQTSDPDELTPHQAIYGAVNDHGLVFPIEGQPDVV